MTRRDVVVIGAGNAAMAAAVGARQAGAARVLVLEKAPKAYRGGNTRCAGGMLRFAFSHPEELLPLHPGLESELPAFRRAITPYPRERFRGALGGPGDNWRADMLAERSLKTVQWMVEQGIGLALATELAGIPAEDGLRFPSGLVFRVDGNHAALAEKWFAIAERCGIDISYRCDARRLLLRDGQVEGVEISDGSRIPAGSVVLACGGFEADPFMRARHLGKAWENARVRGTRYNTGDGLRMALEAGARAEGDWSACHACPIGADSPGYGDDEPAEGKLRIAFNLGIMLNRHGFRFADEASAFPLESYAAMGGTILKQPKGLAYQIFDASVIADLPGHYRVGAFHEAGTMAELLAGLDIDRVAAADTIGTFNDACAGNIVAYDRLDGAATRGLKISKSNWARPLVAPPFRAYPVTGGITFTYGGISIDGHARVIGAGGRPITGLYACGEMVGGVFHDRYVGGAGLVSGALFGRIAGTHAADIRRSPGAAA